jgi:hypothetical protein
MGLCSWAEAPRFGQLGGHSVFNTPNLVIHWSHTNHYLRSILNSLRDVAAAARGSESLCD